MRWAATLLLVGGVAVAGCGDDGGGDASEATEAPESVAAGERAQGQWTRLPDPPLAPRNGAVAAWTGDEVVVVGGQQWLCPPGADCPGPDEPPFADGAAFDPEAGTWRPIADAPVPLAGTEAAVVGGHLYVLAPCARADCRGADELPLLRWRPDADEWDTLPGVPGVPDGFGTSGYLLAPAGDDLVAYAGSDEQGERPDWRFSPDTATWTELPDDPLAPSYDRHVVADGERLLVFAKAIDDPSSPSSSLSPMSAARLGADGRWVSLPDAPGSGFQAWALDGVVVVNPHFGRSAGGGVFTPGTDRWGPLPSPPTAGSWQGDMAGALGRDSAVYEYASGWVLDVPSGRWHEIPDLDDRVSSAVTAAGRDLFVFGGDRWEGQSGDGVLLDDAYLWTAP